MLWTLHNRASEAKRRNTYLPDPACVGIYEAIDYDYVRSFGRADDSHAMRSRIFDDALRPWLARHPGGTVVELACGLETQFQRIDDGKVHWLCVAVAAAIHLRERFLPPTERCRHRAGSALDFSWIDAVTPSRGVFVTAQGLLMYLEEGDVRRLVTTVIERFPGVELMFDAIPRWFSKLTLKGFRKTRHYRTPRMPWGVDRDALEPLLRSWSPAIDSVSLTPYGARRGVPGFLLRRFGELPGLRNIPPVIAHVSSRA
jgi:O-methyltransferase involved in polyketide biosynthesis